jgi:hypothetical protein
MIGWLILAATTVVLAGYTVAYFRHDPNTCPECNRREG